jgi:hypothetical protein
MKPIEGISKNIYINKNTYKSEHLLQGAHDAHFVHLLAGHRQTHQKSRNLGLQLECPAFEGRQHKPNADESKALVGDEQTQNVRVHNAKEEVDHPAAGLHLVDSNH